MSTLRPSSRGRHGRPVPVGARRGLRVGSSPAASTPRRRRGAASASRCRGGGPPDRPRTACRAGRPAVAGRRSPPTAGVRAGSRPARRAPGGRRCGSGRSVARSWVAHGRRTSRSRRARPRRGRRARAAVGRTAGCGRARRRWHACVRRGGEQFHAVADPHLRDQTALGGHDDRDLGQRLLLALQSDPALCTTR